MASKCKLIKTYHIIYIILLWVASKTIKKNWDTINALLVKVINQVLKYGKSDDDEYDDNNDDDVD